MSARSADAREARFLVELNIIIGLFVTCLYQNIQKMNKRFGFRLHLRFRVLVDEQAIST